MKMARKIFSVLLIATLVGSLGFSFFAVTDAFSKLGVITDSRASDAVLASTTVNKAAATFAVTYWRQSSDPCVNQYDLYTQNIARQFEWQSCDYHSDYIETGIVQPKLGADFLPVPAHNSLVSTKLANFRLANRHIYGDNFNRWFHSTDFSTEQNSVLQLNYSDSDDAYVYTNTDFHPVGNSLFTMSFAIPFRTTDNSHFEITADDDTWVFLDDTLMLDLGGIHQPTTASLDLADDGIIYIFHADRDSAESVFDIKMSHVAFPISDTAIAYDDSSYVAPLGESMTAAPDYRSAIVNTITIELIVLCFLVLMTPFAVRLIMRH